MPLVAREGAVVIGCSDKCCIPDDNVFESMILELDCCRALKRAIGAILPLFVNILSVSLGNKLVLTELRSNFNESPFALVNSLIFLVSDLDFFMVSLSTGSESTLPTGLMSSLDLIAKLTGTDELLKFSSISSPLLLDQPN